MSDELLLVEDIGNLWDGAAERKGLWILLG